MISTAIWQMVFGPLMLLAAVMIVVKLFYDIHTLLHPKTRRDHNS